MDKIIHAIANLIEKLDKFRSGAYILLVLLFFGFGGVIVYNTNFKLSTPDNTNSIAIPSRLANDLDNYLSHIQNETEADIVGIALYKFDEKYEELYITFVRQSTNPGVYPIPNTKYFLTSNNLYSRYLIHKKGKCFSRSFEQTNSRLAISCPFFDKNKELAGYVTVEYVNDTPPKTAKELEILVSTYTDNIEKILDKNFLARSVGASRQNL